MSGAAGSAVSGRRQMFAGTVGNILEWYDFAVYGFLAPVMSPLFFPDHDPLTGLINTYGIFAAGYLMRPLGGIIFGRIGDRLGRTKALRMSISMMAVPTVLVGLLPVHEQAGVFAAVLLVLLRLVQGVSVGGELIGSMSYLVETAPAHRRGLAGSWSVCGGVAGILLGSLVVTIMGALLTEEAVHQWGWRVPFLGGVVIFLLGNWLRRGLSESPEFLAAQSRGETQDNGLLDVLRELPGRILHVSVCIALYATSFYMLFVWMPTYLTSIVTPPVEHALPINTIAMTLLLAMILVGGRLADRFGGKRVVLSASVVLGIIIYPLFLILDHGVMVEAIVIQFLLAILVGLIQGPVPSILVSCFPAGRRYTAVGISYNLTLALLGGTAPLVATWLIKSTGDIASPALYLAALAFISVVSMSLLKTSEEPRHST